MTQRIPITHDCADRMRLALQLIASAPADTSLALIIAVAKAALSPSPQARPSTLAAGQGAPGLSEPASQGNSAQTTGAPAAPEETAETRQ